MEREEEGSRVPDDAEEEHVRRRAQRGRGSRRLPQGVGEGRGLAMCSRGVRGLPRRATAILAACTDGHVAPVGSLRRATCVTAARALLGASAVHDVCTAVVYAEQSARSHPIPAGRIFCSDGVIARRRLARARVEVSVLVCACRACVHLAWCARYLTRSNVLWRDLWISRRCNIYN